MVTKIDYNRGLIKGKDQSTGVNVYMYLDDPGVYLSSQGTMVSQAVAERAGFDIARHRNERIRRLRIGKAKEMIEAQLDHEESKSSTIKVQNGWAIKHIGFGKHYIEAPDGSIITDRNLTLEQAHGLLQELAVNDPAYDELPPEAVEGAEDNDPVLNFAAAGKRGRSAKGQFTKGDTGQAGS